MMPHTRPMPRLQRNCRCPVVEISVWRIKEVICAERRPTRLARNLRPMRCLRARQATRRSAPPQRACVPRRTPRRASCSYATYAMLPRSRTKRASAVYDAVTRRSRASGRIGRAVRCSKRSVLTRCALAKGEAIMLYMCLLAGLAAHRARRPSQPFVARLRLARHRVRYRHRHHRKLLRVVSIHRRSQRQEDLATRQTLTKAVAKMLALAKSRVAPALVPTPLSQLGRNCNQPQSKQVSDSHASRRETQISVVRMMKLATWTPMVHITVMTATQARALGSADNTDNLYCH